MKGVKMIISILVAFLMGCDKNTNNHTDIIEINLCEGNNTIVMTDFVSPTSFIMLEGTDSCLLRTIDKVVESEDAIYVLDRTSQEISKFNHDGSFLFKIGRKGDGPDEYARVYDIDISDNQQIIYLCVSDSEVLAFDTTSGQFIERYQIDTEIPFSSIQIMGDEIIVAADDVPQEFDRMYILTSDFRFSDSFLNRGPGITSSLCPQIRKGSDRLYFLDWYNNILYNYNQINKDVEDFVHFKLNNDIKTAGINDFMWFMNRQHEVGFISMWGASDNNIVVFSISSGKTNILILDVNLNVEFNSQYSGLLMDLNSSANGQSFITAITYDNYKYYQEILNGEVQLPAFDDNKTNAILMFWEVKPCINNPV